MRPLLLLLIEPAACSAERGVAIIIAVVVQDEHVVPAMRGAELIELRRRRPPVVVVPLHQILFAGELVDEGKVLFRLLDAERPAEVPQKNRRVAGLDHGKPLAELVHVSLPAAAEHVHGLVRAEAKMQITDGV